MKKIFALMLFFALLFTACNGGVTFRSKLDVDTGEVQFAQPQSGDTVAPVSYTHLDVYKRQGLYI